LDIDINLEPDLSPQALAELAVEAEKLGVRALWSSNFHQDWDAFLTLVPAAQATSRILLGPLAVSPWELHPLRMANSLLTLNEISGGRAILAVSGGGGVLGAMGWKIAPGAPVWPFKTKNKGDRAPERRVAGVRDCIRFLDVARRGKLAYAFDGEVFQVTRPFQMKYAQAPGPVVYGCCSGPMMIRMGASVADGIQVSDFTVDMMAGTMANVHAGLARRDPGAPLPPDGFRVGNFWAWHIKEDREASLYEARRELIWRGAIAGKYAHDIRPHLDSDAEVQMVIDHWDAMFKAYWTRTGQIEGMPASVVNRLVHGMSSAGGLDAIDAEIERYQRFAASGVTELCIRLFDQPMDGLRMLGERVLPALRA
jgi:alkanesulfonate monooxygenase SsuD/methylene tetrahydromethanopterin reductase-like flavin-dependent oxidoreductase (luciferase family)